MSDPKNTDDFYKRNLQYVVINTTPTEFIFKIITSLLLNAIKKAVKLNNIVNSGHYVQPVPFVHYSGHPSLSYTLNKNDINLTFKSSAVREFSFYYNAETCDYNKDLYCTLKISDIKNINQAIIDCSAFDMLLVQFVENIVYCPKLPINYNVIDKESKKIEEKPNNSLVCSFKNDPPLYTLSYNEETEQINLKMTKIYLEKFAQFLKENPTTKMHGVGISVTEKCSNILIVTKTINDVREYQLLLPKKGPFNESFSKFNLLHKCGITIKELYEDLRLICIQVDALYFN